MRRYLFVTLVCLSCSGPATDTGSADGAIAEPNIDAGLPSLDAGAAATSAGSDSGVALTAGPDAGLADAGAPPFRDWAAFPALVQLDTPSDVIAIGDVHGDPDRLKAVLVGAGLIASAAHPDWVGGTSVLVFTGDLIDKWNHSLDVLTLVRTLEVQASAAGGRVVVLLGNHEVEFLAAPLDPRTGDFLAELNAAHISPSDVATGANALGRELRSRPFAARINDFFFSHAGNTEGRSLAQLDLSLREALDTQGFTAPALLLPDSMLEARLSPSPWWETSGLSPSTYLTALGGGVHHFVLGHQPASVSFSDGSTRNAGELYCRLGVFFLIDSGMSQGVDKSQGAALELHVMPDGTTRVRSITHTGNKTVLWRG